MNKRSNCAERKNPCDWENNGEESAERKNFRPMTSSHLAELLRGQLEVEQLLLNHCIRALPSTPAQPLRDRERQQSAQKKWGDDTDETQEPDVGGEGGKPLAHMIREEVLAKKAEQASKQGQQTRKARQ